MFVYIIIVLSLFAFFEYNLTFIFHSYSNMCFALFITVARDYLGFLVSIILKSLYGLTTSCFNLNLTIVIINIVPVTMLIPCIAL